MAISVDGPKNAGRARSTRRQVEFQNAKNAKEELQRLLNNESNPNAPKYNINLIPEGKSYTLEVRTRRKEALPYVDQFLKNGSFWGFKVEKIAVQYKLRAE